ncbi:MAG: heavy metal translocating P-type ATPase [Candidatus Goldiibacteriota bacterium]
MKEKNLKIEGMHCAGCVNTIEKAVSGQKGVKSAVVNLAAASAKVVYDPELIKESDIIKTINSKGYAASALEKAENTRGRGRGMRKLLNAFIPSAALALPVFIISMFAGGIFGAYTGVVLWVLATPVQFYSGFRFYKGAYTDIKNLSPGMDTLVALGTSAAYFFSVYLVFAGARHFYFETSSVLITVILLGRILEERAKQKASGAIYRLMELAPTKAVVVRNGKETEVLTASIAEGETVVARPGDRIAVDGAVSDGMASVDESIITGEHMPVDKEKGSRVIAGTVNVQGVIRFTAKKVGADTVLASIVRLVEEAQASKAPVQRFVDRAASVFVPAVLFVSAASFVWWFFGAGSELSFAVTAAVSVLVIACPCALGLATPAAILVGSSIGADSGILIKNGAALEITGKIKYAVFDKTGTITEGKPHIKSIYVYGGLPKNELIGIAAGAEKHSTHPIAAAIVDYCGEKGINPPEASEFSNFAGFGIKAVINGEVYYAGSAGLMEKEGIDISAAADDIRREETEGSVFVFIASREKFLGAACLDDKIREGAKETMNELKKEGVTPVMATGDTETAARRTAAECGIDRVYAKVLPGGKADIVRELRKKGLTAFAGDGINDAPALSAADSGIAVAAGADIALDSADIVLMRDGIKEFLNAYYLSRRTYAKVKQNLFWAFIYNIIGIPVAAMGLLNPMIAGAAMAFSSVSVVLNSMLLKK